MNGRGYYVASLDLAGRRVRAKGLFARGNGRWEIGDRDFSFLRTLTENPIRIPLRRVRSVALSGSSWWGGKWLLGARVVEVTWVRDDGSEVVSGFVLSGSRSENAEAAQLLSAKVRAAVERGHQPDRQTVD